MKGSLLQWEQRAESAARRSAKTLPAYEHRKAVEAVAV